MKKNINPITQSWLMNNCDEYVKIVTDMCDYYKDDEYMKNYIHTFFTSNFQTMLENTKKTYLMRKTHIQEMEQEQEQFIQYFLNTYKYYYVPQTDKFFTYDEYKYSMITEDNILHHILTEISKDKQLSSWKQKTKVSIMKRIKENLLCRSIPNSETIQYVLDLLCPLLFSTKTEAKYFLTILGDNMLKKNNDIIHFIQPKAKQFLRELNNYAQIFMGTNSIQTFKYKYHEHAYMNCRLIQISDSVNNDNLWAHIIQSSVDILCVAFHYSTRYENSDRFITNKTNDTEIVNSIMFLYNQTPENVIDMFIEKYMTTSAASVEISWKTMQYLWKQFLDSMRLPAIIFQNNLKQQLIQKWKNEHHGYNETQDCFLGMNSKFLPSIQFFIRFWNETMVYDPTETDLEMDEISMLFLKYSEEKGKGNLYSMGEKQILDLITCFFPNVEIENEKYIHNYKCTLWDKQLDILSALNIINSSSPEPNGSASIFSTYEYYEKYCRLNTEQKKSCVNKQYFEKYMNELYI